MASITDCVVDGLKYPFTDLKKLLIFGVLFAIIELLSFAISNSTLDCFRIIAKSNEHAFQLKLAHLPMNDVYLIVGLSIISFIIFLFAMGYIYRITQFAVVKKQNLPDFNDIVNLFLSGIKYCIVSLAYNIIPLAVLIIGVMLAPDYAYGGYLILLAMLLFVATYFLMIMALNNMIAYDQLSKAFDFREIIDNISNLGWGKYIGIIIFTLIVFMIVSLAAGLLLSILTVVFLPIFAGQLFAVNAVFGAVEALLVTSYTSAFYARVCGLIYRESVK